MNIDDVLPKVMPAGWHPVESGMVPLINARVWQFKGGIRTITTLEQYPDKSWWIHVSMSYPNRLPTWEDLKAVKNLFIGKKKLAVQILPQEDDYLNFHPFTLHLYARVDGDTLPSLAPNDRTLT
jgi:hypothetical protein